MSFQDENDGQLQSEQQNEGVNQGQKESDKEINLPQKDLDDCLNLDAISIENKTSQLNEMTENNLFPNQPIELSKKEDVFNDDITQPIQPAQQLIRRARTGITSVDQEVCQVDI